MGRRAFEFIEWPFTAVSAARAGRLVELAIAHWSGDGPILSRAATHDPEDDRLARHLDRLAVAIADGAIHTRKGARVTAAVKPGPIGRRPLLV